MIHSVCGLAILNSGISNTWRTWKRKWQSFQFDRSIVCNNGFKYGPLSTPVSSPGPSQHGEVFDSDVQ